MTRAVDVMIRLLFVDKGAYHYEEIEVPKALLTGYEQLLDLLREKKRSVLKRLYIDLDRLSSVQIVGS